jgi:RNA polymerase sigma-B factor
MPTTDATHRSPIPCGDDRDSLTDLFRRWQNERDPKARDRLIERFMPLTRKLARRYIGANQPFEDLLQVASVGLLLAIDRFDCERGTAFTSFAVPTILGELRRYFRDLGWAVHVPRAAQERALRIDAAEKQLIGERGRSPSITRLAEVLEWSVEDVVTALEARAAHHASSLNAPQESGDAEHGELLDGFGEPDERFDLIDARLSIAAAARRLSQHERRVLEMRYVGEMTQAEIGKELGVSQMQVSRLERQCLHKLREMTAS